MRQERESPSGKLIRTRWRCGARSQRQAQPPLPADEVFARVIFAGAVGRMLLVDPTPAFTAASSSRQLAATGKLQPSVGENTADAAAAAAAVGIDSVSQSGEKTLSAPLAVTTFSHNVWPDILFFCFFFEGILLFF